MKESLQSRQERNLWVYHLLEVSRQRIKHIVALVPLPQRLHPEINKTVNNMVDLVARTSQDLATTMQISLALKVFTILTPRHKAPQQTRSLPRKLRTKSQPWMTVAQILMTQMLIVMIRKLKEKRRKSKRERLRRRL
jgi:hypothetical protein